MAWLRPLGKYQRSPGPWLTISATPSGSTTVTWQWPSTTKAHSAELCQCISREPPALMNRCAPAIPVAIGSPRVVISRAQPPDVALIGPLSSEAVKTTGSPDFRGIVFRKSDAGETSYPAARPSGGAAKDSEVARAPAPITSVCRKIRRSASNMTHSYFSLAELGGPHFIRSMSSTKREMPHNHQEIFLCSDCHL